MKEIIERFIKEIIKIIKHPLKDIKRTVKMVITLLTIISLIGVVVIPIIQWFIANPEFVEKVVGEGEDEFTIDFFPNTNIYIKLVLYLGGFFILTGIDWYDIWDKIKNSINKLRK